MHAITIDVKKQDMNLQESGGKYMGEFERRLGKGEVL